MTLPQWQRAKVIRLEQVAEEIMSIIVEPAHWQPHIAGQHYELRMPGQEASRKYSVVSSPLQQGRLEFGVKLYETGILSPKLWALKPGAHIEIRGPLGESFVWRPDSAEGVAPLVLIGAGSGITPLLAIFEHHKAQYSRSSVTFIVSAKAPSHIMRYNTLKNVIKARLTATQGRIDHAYLKEVTGALASTPKVRCYICGSEDFIDTIVDELIDLGFSPERIRSEKFD